MYPKVKDSMRKEIGEIGGVGIVVIVAERIASHPICEFIQEWQVPGPSNVTSDSSDSRV